jgi:hypothetical protein
MQLHDLHSVSNNIQVIRARRRLGEERRGKERKGEGRKGEERKGEERDAYTRFGGKN